MKYMNLDSIVSSAARITPTYHSIKNYFLNYWDVALSVGSGIAMGEQHYDIGIASGLSGDFGSVTDFAQRHGNVLARFGRNVAASFSSAHFYDENSLKLMIWATVFGLLAVNLEHKRQRINGQYLH
jgi:hypothetical protein